MGILKKKILPCSLATITAAVAINLSNNVDSYSEGRINYKAKSTIDYTKNEIRNLFFGFCLEVMNDNDLAPLLGNLDDKYYEAIKECKKATTAPLDITTEDGDYRYYYKNFHSLSVRDIRKVMITMLKQMGYQVPEGSPWSLIFNSIDDWKYSQERDDKKGDRDINRCNEYGCFSLDDAI